MWPWKNPLQLLGKTSLRALLYFWKLPFYSENYSAKNQQANLQLISFPVPHSNLEITANRTAINVVRPPFCVQKNQQTAPRFLCKNLPFTMCWISCTNLLNCCLGMCAKLLSPSPPCSEISLALLLSFSQSAHERMNDLFLLFLL